MQTTFVLICFVAAVWYLCRRFAGLFNNDSQNCGCSGCGGCSGGPAGNGRGIRIMEEKP